MTGGEPPQADLTRSPWRQYRKSDSILSLPSDRAVLKIQVRNEMSRAVTHPAGESKSLFLRQKRRYPFGYLLF